MPGTFNPWRDVDPEHDASADGPARRADHLQRFLEERMEVARLLLVGEALGHRGGRFSGIPMTSERILMNGLSGRGVHAADVIARGGLRTSRPDRFPPAGIAEATATSTWCALKEAGVQTRHVVFWNAFPFHPMDGRPLSNRRPSNEELERGHPFLEELIRLFPHTRIVAVGNVSHDLLKARGFPIQAKVRHPAKGGATKFREGILQLLG